MLSMDYFDRDGNKWSIEKGDWLSHQSMRHHAEKSNKSKSAVHGLLIMLVLIIVITFFSIT
jgi:hypothetical protein